MVVCDHVWRQTLKGTIGQSNESCLVDLPVEMLCQISSHLSITRLAYLAATCRKLKTLLLPELYSRDRSTGAYRTLSWATCARKGEAIATINRARMYWPQGIHDLQIHFSGSKACHGKTIRNLTPLMAAIQAVNLPIVEYLLANHVDIHQHEGSSRHRDTLWFAIHHAMMMDHVAVHMEPYQTNDKLVIIKRLIHHGANPNQLSLPDPKFNTRPNIEGIGKVTPLHLAIRNGADIDVINLLLESGAAATRLPYYGVLGQRFTNVTPISHLLNAYDEPTESHQLATRKIIAHGGGIGVEAQSYTATGYPLLIDFLRKPRSSPHTAAVTKEILEGARVRIEDKTLAGDNALLHLLKSHIGWKPPKHHDRRLVLTHEERRDMQRIAAVTCDTIDVLLEHHIDINEKDSVGRTPLHIAAGLHQNYSIIFDYLVKRGACVKSRCSRGRTVLHALVDGDSGADYMLIPHLIRKFRINPRSRDNDGNTFLHLLVRRPLQLHHKWIQESAKHFKRGDWDKFINKTGQSPLNHPDCRVNTLVWVREAYGEELTRNVFGERNIDIEDGWDTADRSWQDGSKYR